MLSGCEQVEKHIVLRANAHKLSDLVHLLKHVDVIYLRLTLTLLDQPSQHRNHGRFSRSVMPQKCKYLTVIHLHVDSLHGSEPAREHFLEIFDAQVFIRGLKSFANDWRCLVIVRRHLLRFKLVTFDNFAIFGLGAPASRAAAASVVAGRAEEARAEPLAIVGRNDLVHVEAQHEKERKVECQHPERRIKRIFLVYNCGRRGI